jgi:baseplate upper protein BppU/tail-like repeat protein/tail fiber-like repeat protein
LLKTFNVTLDIEKELYNPAIMSFSISQADLSIVEITMIIRQDDNNFDLTEATSVQLGIKKPSGLVVYQDCEITDPAAGEIKATLTNQAYIEWGIYTAEVYIKDYDALADQDQIAVTCPFFYYSRSAVMSDEALESFNDWTALQDLLLTYDKKPILVEGIPTGDPEYIGQIAFDTIGRRAFIAGGLTADLWQIIGGSGEGGGGGVVSWADIIGKPTSFPPSSHRHNWTDLDNVPTAFFPISHTHIWTDITDKPTTFAPSTHLHTISDITGLQGSLDGKADDADLIPFITEIEADGKYALKGETGATSFDWVDITGKPTTFPSTWTDVSGKPTTFTPAAHTHTWTEITGKPTTFTPTAHTHDFTIDITGKPASYPSTWTDVSGKPTTFTPTAHTHTWTEVTGKPTTFAPSAHTHTIADVTGLQAELDAKIEAIPPEYLTESEGDIRYAFKGEAGGGGSTLVEDVLTSTSTTSALSANQGRILNNSKAPITHTHLWADITDKPTTFPTDPIAWDDVTGKPATFVPSAHTHTIADVTGLQTELDGKADDVHTHLWADITDKPTTFAPSAHTHAWTEVTGKPTTFTPTAHTHLWADLTDKPTTFTPATHTHTIADVSNLQSSLDGKSNVGHTHAWTEVTGKPTTFAPTAHTHLWAEITDKPTTFTPAAHTHLWADLTDKPTAFAPILMSGAQRGGAMVGNGLAMSNEYLLVKTLTSGGTKIDVPNNAVVIDRTTVDAWYALKTHTHLWADLTDKPTTFTPTAHTHLWADITDKPTTFTPATHSHAISDVTGLQGALDGKVDDAQMNGLTLWKGTQAAYDALTPDPNTLYFISG